MGFDASGNWTPVLPDPPAITKTWTESTAGDGAPDADLGGNGDTYVNLLTGDLYVKVSGAWILNVPGSGAIEAEAGNYAGGEPTFTPASSVALGYDTSTDPATQWIWHSGAWH